MTYKKRKVIDNHPEYIKYNINLDVIVGVLTGRQVEPEGPRPGGAGGAEAPPSRRGVVQGDGGVSATEVAGVQWAGRPGPGWVARARDARDEVSRWRHGMWLRCHGTPCGVTPNPSSWWR